MDLTEDLMKEQSPVLDILHLTKHLFISNLFHCCSKWRNMNKTPASVTQEKMQ